LNKQLFVFFESAAMPDGCQLERNLISMDELLARFTLRAQDPRTPDAKHRSRCGTWDQAATAVLGQPAVPAFQII
jgi:hypothetical protein